MQAAKQEAAIRERAYLIWEQEGRPDGREWDHWERAATEIVSRPTNIEAERAAPKTKNRLRSVLKSAFMAREAP